MIDQSKNDVDEEAKEITNQFRKTGIVNENSESKPRIKQIFSRLEFLKQHNLLSNIDEGIQEFK